MNKYEIMRIGLLQTALVRTGDGTLRPVAAQAVAAPPGQFEELVELANTSAAVDDLVRSAAENVVADPDADVAFTTMLMVLNDIRRERQRHFSLGYDAKHDDEYGSDDLADRARPYIARATRWVHDSGRREQLVKAASLLVAAIEAHDREVRRAHD